MPRRLLTLTLLLALGASWAYAALPPDEQRRRETRVHFLRAEDSTAVVSVGANAEATKEVLVPTDEKTKIFLDSKPIKLADIPANTPMVVFQTEGLTTLIEARTVHEPKRQTFQASLVSAKGSSLTVKTDKEATYWANEKTAVIIAGKSVPLSDLKVGDTVTLTVSDGRIIKIEK